MYQFGKHSKFNLSEVDSRLQDIANQAIKETTIDFGVSDGLRTLQEQQYFFSKGLSRCDGIVKKSRHQSGNAIDIYAYVAGKASYKYEHMKYLTDLFKKIAKEKQVTISTGIDWKDFPDAPHIELKS